MLTQIQVRVYPTGGGLYWAECTLCGPLFLLEPDTVDTTSVAHLNSHGCQILLADDTDTTGERPPPGTP